MPKELENEHKSFQSFSERLRAWLSPTRLGGQQIKHRWQRLPRNVKGGSVFASPIPKQWMATKPHGCISPHAVSLLRDDNNRELNKSITCKLGRLHPTTSKRTNHLFPEEIHKNKLIIKLLVKRARNAGEILSIKR